jgi:hypothetical protein
MISKMKRASTGTAVSLTLIVAATAFADDPTLNLALNSDQWVDTTGRNNGTGQYVFEDVVESLNGRLDYRVDVLPSPTSVLGFSFDITNTTGATQVYTLTSGIAVGAMMDGCLLGASIGGSVTDANFDGSASLSSYFSNPLFWGGIDYSAPSQLQLATLINAPFTINAPFIGGTASVGPASIGLPGPSVEGAAFAAGYQTIALRFALSAGDRASFSGVFVLQPIPAPAAFASFALSGLLVRRRRR